MKEGALSGSLTASSIYTKKKSIANCILYLLITININHDQNLSVGVPLSAASAS